MDIKFVKRDVLKEKPTENLGFGKYFTDYMFEMDYYNGKWQDARIVPYGPLNIDPATMVLHYAQETFEGLKAYRTKDNQIQLFRPHMNARRMINSNIRMCMPYLEEEDFVQACEELVKVEKQWVPSMENTSLYLRPFMFATESSVGVHAASNYKFVIIASPVASYYEEGLKPVKIYVETEYVRATKGGTGFAKCGGNYASSIIAQEKAKKLGYSQVLWLDGVHRKYIEEVGTMNVMFLINGEIYTAPIDGTILPGITRDSILTLLKGWGYKINETHLSIDDLVDYYHQGLLQEAFGTGTAAVISIIKELSYKDEKMIINDGEIGELANRLYNTLTGIQYGRIKDEYNWIKVCK